MNILKNYRLKYDGRYMFCSYQPFFNFLNIKNTRIACHKWQKFRMKAYNDKTTEEKVSHL